VGESFLGGSPKVVGRWVEALPPPPHPSLRAVADGAAIQSHTNLPTRPCEAQRAEAIQKKSNQRGLLLGRFTAFAMTGVEMTGLRDEGIRVAVQSHTNAPTRHCEPSQTARQSSRDKTPTRPCEVQRTEAIQKKSNQRGFFLGRFTAFAMTGMGMAWVRNGGKGS
jgi:hypothetical protein